MGFVGGHGHSSRSTFSIFGQRRKEECDPVHSCCSNTRLRTNGTMSGQAWTVQVHGYKSLGANLLFLCDLLDCAGRKGKAESSNGTIFCCFWFKDSIDRKNPGFISFGGFHVQLGKVIFRQELPCQTAKSNIFHSAYGENTDKMRIRRAKQKSQTTLNQLIGIFHRTQSRYLKIKFFQTEAFVFKSLFSSYISDI